MGALGSPSRIISIDLDDNHLAVARKLGATETVNESSGNAVERTLALTNGRGVDCAIEAVGIPLGGKQLFVRWSRFLFLPGLRTGVTSAKRIGWRAVNFLHRSDKGREEREVEEALAQH